MSRSGDGSQAVSIIITTIICLSVVACVAIMNGVFKGSVFDVYVQIPQECVHEGFGLKRKAICLNNYKAEVREVQ